MEEGSEEPEKSEEYDEEIERIIERKIQEGLDGRVEKEVEKRMEERIEMPEDKTTSEPGETVGKTEGGLSRRSFLKMLGLGAGGMALSSAAAGAGWSVLQPSTSGASDIKSSEVADNAITSSKIVDGTIQRNDTAFSPQKTRTIKSSSTTAYTTSDEDVIYVDTSSAAVTITLASTDATQGNEIEVHNISGANPVTVDTEGTETIDPGAEASKSIGKAGWSVSFVSDGSNWDSSLEGEFESLSTGNGKITSSNKDIPGVPSSSSDPAIGFGTWRQVSSSRPALVQVEAYAQTDGSSNAAVRVSVDESGGATADYKQGVAYADADAGAGNSERNMGTFLLPVGAQYKVVNAADPAAANTVDDVREIVL